MGRRQNWFLLLFEINKRLLATSTARSQRPIINFTKPTEIDINYWKRVIWVALDLKNVVRENNKKSLKLLETKHITFMFAKANGRFQVAYSLACDILGARSTLYFDSNIDHLPNPADIRKAMSRLTDMIIVHGLHHDVLTRLAFNSTLPIFPASCNVYAFQKALSDLMTIQENFKRLRGLTLAWVGPPAAVFNSYLVLCPAFGMNIQYTCICKYGSGHMSPVQKMCVDCEDIVKEFTTAEETVGGAHLVSTSMHLEENNKITLEVLKKADKNWLFVHTLPRSRIEVDEEVFSSDKNMCWMTTENYLYIAMATIILNLQNYEPEMKMPDFEGTTEALAEADIDRGKKSRLQS